MVLMVTAATILAVSALNTALPKLTEINHDCSAAATSSAVKSPSGPMQIMTSCLG